MKKYRLRIVIYISILAGIVSLLSLSCFNYWKQIYNNNKLKEELEDQSAQLLEDETTLESEVVKLQDPEYVAKYAREKFMFSKDGEIIIKLPDDE